jgi:hypothetical protein
MAPRGSWLLALLRLPLRFDLADVLLFDLTVPILTALLLTFGSNHVPMFHGVLLCVMGG